MIDIKIQGHRSTDFPMCKIKLNNQILLDQPIIGTMNLKFNVDLQPKNILHIEHYGKLSTDTILDSDGNIESDRAIELKSISIYGYAIPKVLMYRQKFFVDWWDHDIEEFDKNNQTVPGFLINNVYFGHNGYYEYCFDKDIVKNYYTNLWQEEHIANQDLQQVKEFDGELKETFNLYGNESDITEEFDKTIFDLLDIIEKD